MNDTATASSKDTRHSYRRPKDAATLILVDRSSHVPKVLVGRRHNNILFMPGKIVFPGGRVDATDNRIPIAAPLPHALEKKLTGGSPKIDPARARALAVAAIREVCEETGLCLGKSIPFRLSAAQSASLQGEWKPFADAGLLPDPSQLFLIARAITPAGLVRRYDTRFFTADASAIAHRVEGVVHDDAELVELIWIELGASPLADMHHITRRVLGELEARLATGPLSHQAPVPFFHYRNGQMLCDTI
ncbi:MAG: NUDIX hydrolase [Xanthobacteraceae bacterium]|nr:NUDIX hydrolase [Xanthobacteraceae bacterium]